MDIHYSTTSRGFTDISFTDFYGKRADIQKSSLATDDAIWFGLLSAEPMVLASQAAKLGVTTSETTGWVPYPVPDEVLLQTRMHLTREQVAALLPILRQFVETGELPTNG